MKIPVSKNYLNEQLQSHPDYPSLLSITETLDELGIENIAIEIPKEHLHEVPVPFFAHLYGHGDEFAVVKDRDDLDKQFPDFFKRWSRVIVLAEKPAKWDHKENNEWLRNESRKLLNIVAFCGLLCAFIIASILLTGQWQQVALLVIGVAGFFTVLLLVSKDLGLENKIADKICGDDANCDSVIRSKAAYPLPGISWSDVGIIWFSFLILAILISSFEKNITSYFPVLSVLAICSLPFTIFSLYYQLRKKKWCRLCLIVVALLWMQYLVFIPQLSLFVNWKFDWNNLILSGLLLFLVSSTWLAVKSLLKSNKKIESENFANLRFKNNPDIFVALLQKQKKVDTTPFENDLQIGNADSSLQILVACSPYCGPCAQAHKELHELVEKNDIGLTLRFTIKSENEDNKKLQAAKYIFQLLNGETQTFKRTVLHDWFKLINLERFSDLYPLNSKADEEVTGTVRQHEIWTAESKIQFTPTIFLNGYELPKEYKVHNLKLLIKAISENINRQKDRIRNELI